MAFAPVTQERIEATLDQMGLKHYRSESDGVTVTAFPSAVCFFRLDGDMLNIVSRWLGKAHSEEEQDALRRAINHTNRSLPRLRAHRVDWEDGAMLAFIDAPFFPIGGLEDEQLIGMLDFYFAMLRYATDQLNELLPELSDARDAAGADSTEGNTGTANESQEA